MGSYQRSSGIDQGLGCYLKDSTAAASFFHLHCNTVPRLLRHLECFRSMADRNLSLHKWNAIGHVSSSTYLTSRTDYLSLCSILAWIDSQHHSDCRISQARLATAPHRGLCVGGRQDQLTISVDLIVLQ